MTGQCDVTVGYDVNVRAASWSCQCGASEVIPHARPGMGERVAKRLAGINAERHLQGLGAPADQEGTETS